MPKDILKEASFWTIRKSGKISEIERHQTNPINTSYELLWFEVKKADPSTIANTLRRILEHYFKILGRTDFDAICEMFQGNDRLVCKSLFSWVHAGSHGILDDLHVSSNGVTTDIYLRVFREIFEKSEHDAHYRMMMEEGVSAKAPKQDNDSAIKPDKKAA